MNLIEAFFSRNLTEAESQALDELLERSPEEAARFAQRLEKEYFSLGLPAPQMPAHLLKTLSAAPAMPWLSILAAGGLLCATGLAWWAWPSAKPPLSISPQPPAVVPSLSRPPVVQKLLAPPPAVPEAVTGPSASGNRLNVVVDLDNAAPVTVQVLDVRGEVVRPLYAGTLPAGRWSLKWDGRLSDGSRAGAGDYRIEVRSGANRMTRTVSLAAP